MSIRDEVLRANAEYANSFGSKADLALPPARGFAILTCMDARLDPAKYARVEPPLEAQERAMLDRRHWLDFHRDTLAVSATA